MKALVKEDEFDALLKIEGKRLDVCKERRTTHKGGEEEQVKEGWSAAVIKGPHILREGELRKTRQGAINSLYRRYYANP
jgi:hypothetical protein